MEEPETHDLLMALYIQMSRVYDALMLMLDNDVRERLHEMHSKGQLLGADPILDYTGPESAEDSAETPEN